MAEYTITLSKKNMKLLLDHAFIGNWVLTSNYEGDEEKTKEYKFFFDTILSIMKNYHIADDEIEYHEKYGYTLKQEKENLLVEELNYYDEQHYWEELAGALAFRDIQEKHGKQWPDMDIEEQCRLRFQEEEKYTREFEAQGIDNLRLQKKR